MVITEAGRLVTSLDVLDDLFDGLPNDETVEHMSALQIDDLGAKVNANAEKLSRIKPITSRPGDLVYPGGWLGNGWQHQIFRRELNCALLYEPRLLVHDPLAEYFFSDFSQLPEVTLKLADGSIMTHGARMWANSGRRTHRLDNIAAIREDLKAIFQLLRLFEPLIRNGTVVMRSQFPLLSREWHALDSSVRADMKTSSLVQIAEHQEGMPLPRWDNLRGLHVAPPGGLLDPADPKQWQPEFYYLAKSLMFSNSAGAQYAPSTENELALLKAKVASTQRGVRALAPSAHLIEEVLRQMIPDLHLDPATAVKVHQSEEAFDEWRRELRELQLTSKGVVDEDLPQLVSDKMQPRIGGVRKAVSKSEVLREKAPKNIALAIVSAISSFSSGPADMGVAAVATGVGGALLDMYGRNQLDGSQPVIAALLHSE